MAKKDSGFVKSPAEAPATPKYKGGAGCYDHTPNIGPPRTKSKDQVPEKFFETDPGSTNLKD